MARPRLSQGEGLAVDPDRRARIEASRSGRTSRYDAGDAVADRRKGRDEHCLSIQRKREVFHRGLKVLPHWAHLMILNASRGAWDVSDHYAIVAAQFDEPYPRVVRPNRTLWKRSLKQREAAGRPVSEIFVVSMSRPQSSPL